MASDGKVGELHASADGDEETKFPFIDLFLKIINIKNRQFKAR